MKQIKLFTEKFIYLKLPLKFSQVIYYLKYLNQLCHLKIGDFGPFTHFVIFL